MTDTPHWRVLRGMSETAEALGVSERMVRRWMQTRDLPVTYTPKAILLTTPTLLAAWRRYCRDLDAQGHRWPASQRSGA